MEATTPQQAAAPESTAAEQSTAEPARPPQPEPGPVPARPPASSPLVTALSEALAGQVLQDMVRDIIREVVRESFSRSGLLTAWSKGTEERTWSTSGVLMPSHELLQQPGKQFVLDSSCATATARDAVQSTTS